MKNASSLLTALNEPIIELDLRGRVLAATASAVELCGLDIQAKQEAGIELAEAVTTKERARFSQAVKRVADGKINQTILEIYLAGEHTEADGVPIEAKLAAITGLNGKPSGVAVRLRDLTLEKANEAAANVQGTHLLDLVENVTDACVVESADGAVEMINDAFCHLFGIKEAPQSLVGTSCSTLFESASTVTVKRVGPVYFPLDSSSNSNQRDQLDFALLAGEIIDQTTLAVDGEGGVAGRLHLFHRKIAQASATPEEKLSSGMVAAQMTLIEKIARELVVILEGAASASLRAEQLDMPGQILEHFRRVETAATSAFDSVAGLLDFSRIEGGDISLQSAPFRLRENIAAMMASLVTHAEQRHVQLRLRIEQDVPDRMTGDSARLMLSLRNLLDAALATFPTEQGDGKLPKLTLIIAPEYESDGRIHLAFTVEPTIHNVKPQPLPPSAVMQIALARQIVRAMVKDGRIEATERKTGVSYQFTAAFPFDATKPPKPRPTFVTLSSLPALIVSSDPLERKQLADWMKSWRMLPREADNTTMAIQLLIRMAEEGNPLPLVITSNQLPVQDGFLLSFRIKQHPLLKQTAVIMLATGGKPGDAIMCRENGISAYLRQPVAPQQLNDAISAVLGAQDDAEATTTLITRHSLRESKKASVLIIDAAKDQAMFAAAGLKKRDYRVVVSASADEAYNAMLAEEFNVVVVDPEGCGFVADSHVIEQIKQLIGSDRPIPTILLSGETPPVGEHGFSGFVLKPYAKDSIVNAVADLLPETSAPSAS
jgi:CheY-like chemotaxis protein/PAS domain-containing protein